MYRTSENIATSENNPERLMDDIEHQIGHVVARADQCRQERRRHAGDRLLHEQSCDRDERWYAYDKSHTTRVKLIVPQF